MLENIDLLRLQNIHEDFRPSGFRLIGTGARRVTILSSTFSSYHLTPIEYYS
jgi:hypothetical protein